MSLNANQTPPSPKLSTVSLQKIAATAFTVEETSSSPKLPSTNSTFCLSTVETSPQKLSTCNATFNLSPAAESSYSAKPFSIHDYGLSEAKLTKFSELSKNLPSHSDMSTNKTVFRLSADFQTKISPLKEIPVKTLSYAQFIDIPLKLSTGIVSATAPRVDDEETSPMETSYSVDEASAFDATIVLGPSAAPAHEFMPTNAPSPFDSTIILSKNDAQSPFDSTIILSAHETPLDSTMVLSKSDEDRRRTFLVPTIAAENKENFSTNKMPAPIAMVSPMTSLVSSSHQGVGLPGKFRTYVLEHMF